MRGRTVVRAGRAVLKAQQGREQAEARGGQARAGV
jgi:hypothetical protein